MRNSAYWKAWAIAASVRALKTFAQTAVSMTSVCSVISEVNWIAVVSASTLSAICSILMSIAGLPEVSAPEENSNGDGLE